MVDIRMYDVLHNYGFSYLADNFERDIITTVILCKESNYNYNYWRFVDLIYVENTFTITDDKKSIPQCSVGILSLYPVLKVRIPGVMIVQ